MSSASRELSIEEEISERSVTRVSSDLSGFSRVTVVNRKTWPPRTRGHAMSFRSRRPVFEQFRRFQVGRGRSIRHIDGYVLFQLNVIRAQKRDC
jgi:hypothetical protein